jgi:hypothetical protein
LDADESELYEEDIDYENFYPFPFSDPFLSF